MVLAEVALMVIGLLCSAVWVLPASESTEERAMFSKRSVNASPNRVKKSQRKVKTVEFLRPDRRAILEGGVAVSITKSAPVP